MTGLRPVAWAYELATTVTAEGYGGWNALRSALGLPTQKPVKNGRKPKPRISGQSEGQK